MNFFLHEIAEFAQGNELGPALNYRKYQLTTYQIHFNCDWWQIFFFFEIIMVMCFQLVAVRTVAVTVRVHL